MTINQMRNYIAQHPKYKSTNWTARCMTMPDNQVIALYNKFRKMDYKKIQSEMRDQDKDNEQYHQINIFEYYGGNNVD